MSTGKNYAKETVYQNTSTMNCVNRKLSPGTTLIGSRSDLLHLCSFGCITVFVYVEVINTDLAIYYGNNMRILLVQRNKMLNPL